MLTKRTALMVAVVSLIVSGLGTSYQPVAAVKSNALPAGAAQRSGLVALSAPSGPDVTTTATSFVDVSQLKGNLYLGVTSDLAITMCAETYVSSGKRMFVRALVDDVVTSPSDVVFAATTVLETHCFTFVAKGVGAGVRTIRMQWRVDSGGTASLGDRTLHVAFAPPDAAEFNLWATAAPSGPDSIVTDTWTDIPTISQTIQLSTTSDLAITFSAEAYTTNGKRLFIRALVDGQVANPSDEVLTQGGYSGTRTFTFIKSNIGSGNHSIRLQGYADGGGEGHVGDRTLAVIAVQSVEVGRAGRLLVAAPSGPLLTTTSSSWVNIPDLNGTLDVPVAGDVSIRFSAEILATGNDRIFVRALLDGQATAPSDVLLGTGDPAGTLGYTFVQHNVSRGSHAVTLQWLVDAGGTAYIGDRTLAAYHHAGQVPVLLVAMESDRGAPDYAYGGYFANTVVDIVGGQRVFKPYVASRLFLDFPSIADYFLENSAQRFSVVPATNVGALGPYLKQYTEKYYREQVPDCFTVMKLEALSRADQTLDFSLYDRNGDGTVTRGELAINIIFYQDSTFGEVRNIPAYVTDDDVTLAGHNIATVYTPDFQQVGQIGVFVHELSHALINAGDMYESSWDPTAPGPYSLMDQHAQSPHLDPYHKLHAGDWFDPIVVTQDGYYSIPAVEQEPLIFKLQDNSSHTGEFFLVENRQHLGYDQYLPDTGLAIWHIDETRMPNYRTAVEMEPAVGATHPIQWQNYLYDGAGSLWGKDFWDGSSGSNARWHDGSQSGIGVWAIPSSGSEMQVFLDVPGPGILVDMKPDLAIVPIGGAAVFQVRLVNTGSFSDQFGFDTNLPGTWATWSANPVSLDSYEQRIITLTVKPVWAGQDQVPFWLVGQSLTNAGVHTSHTARLLRGSAVYLPLVIRGN